VGADGEAPVIDVEATVRPQARRRVVATAALVAIGCGALGLVAVTQARPSGRTVVAAAGDPSGDVAPAQDEPASTAVADTTTALEATTTTAGAAPAAAVTTPTSAGVTRTTRRTTTSTARPATPTTSAADWWPMTPLEPGTQPAGAGGYGASRDATNGRTRVAWSIYERDQYENGELQTTAEIDDPGLVADVLIDFGDGTTWRPPDGNYGRICEQARPRPIYYQGPRHTYATVGDFTVKVTVTTRLCDDGTPDSTTTTQNPYGPHDAGTKGIPGTDNVTSVMLTAHRHPGRQPRPPCCNP
jgi:hypothetical protein